MQNSLAKSLQLRIELQVRNLPLRNSSCEDEILSENLFIILLKLYPSIGGKGDKTSDRGGNKTSSKSLT